MLIQTPRTENEEVAEPVKMKEPTENHIPKKIPI